VRLHLTGHSKFVENAFGHPGKYEYHRVHSVLLVTLQKSDHVDTERQKRTVEKAVHHEHLTCRYQKKKMFLILKFLVKFSIFHRVMKQQFSLNCSVINLSFVT